MSAPRVTAVTEASPAHLAGLRIGDELLSVNGRQPRNIIEYQQLVDDELVDVVVRRSGVDEPVRIVKRAEEPLGMAVSSAVFDRVRTCDNHCAFCFIHELPKGMRRTLYLKDDDYRLSFLYGNFTTLTRFTELDAERILTERLGPLFVSIHATDPDVRAHMLRNPKGATSLRWLQVLLDGGIEVHGQVVVCPGVNDGAVLEDTLATVLDRYPALATLGCVPLGVSRYSNEFEMRPHTPAEAAQVVDTVTRWQQAFYNVLGRRMVWCADEYYLVAGRAFPDAATYDGFPQHENGIGMVPAFERAFLGDDSAAHGVRPGFFAWVEGAPAAGYRAPRAAAGDRRGQSSAIGGDVAVVTGTYGAEVLAPLLAGLPGVRILTVANDFFGGNIGVAGLLTGEDLARALAAQPEGDRYLLPDACLSEGRFLDGLTLDDLPRQVQVVPADGRSLRLALEGILDGGADQAVPDPVDTRPRRDGPRRRRGVSVSAGPGSTADPTTRPVAPTRRLPVVAVAGRPNVGKSSLVNRIVGRRAAVVEHQPGVTRDRKELEAEWTGVPFIIVDTGGWLASGNSLDEKVSAQAEKAVQTADLVLFVVDVIVGATEEDVSAIRTVLRAGTPVLLVANKVDDRSREDAVWELMSLGAGDPWPISALHGRGTGDLLDEVVRRLADTVGESVGADTATEGAEAPGGLDGADPDHMVEDGDQVPDDGDQVLQDAGPKVPRVALVGRPNVGKSTLFNRLIGEERSIVHDLPGTTRDAIDTVITTDEGPLCFVDTAGMRRPSRTDYGVESYATLRALEALDRADIALLLIDATVGATHQDQRLAERIGAAGCPAVIVLNKWDLVATEDREDVLLGVGDRLAFLGLAPVLRVSATTGRAHRILPALHAAVSAYHSRIPTGALNRALGEIQIAHPPHGAKIRYGVQGAIDPPTFTLFTNGRLSPTYLRYVERGLRERFELGSTPIKLRVRLGGR